MAKQECFLELFFLKSASHTGNTLAGMKVQMNLSKIHDQALPTHIGNTDIFDYNRIYRNVKFYAHTHPVQNLLFFIIGI